MSDTRVAEPAAGSTPAGSSAESRQQSESRLLLHESYDAHGTLIRTWVGASEGQLWFETDGATRLALPGNAIQAVMARYGKPLEDPPNDVQAPFVLDDGSVVFRLRFLPTFDVIAKDYMVWRAPGQPPVAELATHVTAALEHLARVASASFQLK